jgi:hypothetical protein
MVNETQENLSQSQENTISAVGTGKDFDEALKQAIENAKSCFASDRPVNINWFLDTTKGYSGVDVSGARLETVTVIIIAEKTFS